MDIRFLLEGFHVPGITVRTAIEKNWSIIRREAIMNDTAYDPSYLDSMKLSGRYLFKLIARNCPDCFDTIRRYMKSDYRKYMDMGNPLYLCKTPKQILGNMGITINAKAEISNTYDEFILEWMSDCYVTLQWRYRLWSSEMIDMVKPEKLYKQYYPLHETSLSNAVVKIYNIYHLEKLSAHRAKRIY